MSVLFLVVGLVVAERAAELVYAARNTSRLRAAGAVELDARGYPWFVALHVGWLAGMLLLVPAATAPSWLFLAAFAALQPVRLWVLATLGPRWTTRLIVLPGAPLVEGGPYRWLRHPNYLVVVAEIALLPLAFGAIALALVGSAANLVLIGRRIAIEERALAPYRHA